MTAETLKKANEIQQQIDSYKHDLYKWEHAGGFAKIELQNASRRMSSDIRYDDFIDFRSIKIEAIKWLNGKVSEKEKELSELQ